MCFLSENVARKVENAFTDRKRLVVNRAETSIAKAKTRLRSGSVARKGENTFVQRKCLSQSRKRVHRTQTSHEKIGHIE